MTTVAEQHVADLAAVLASSSGPAVDAVVGTIPLRLIREPGGMAADQQAGVVLAERENWYLLYADLGFVPVANSELVINGVRWIVETVPWKGDVLQLSVARYVA